MRTVHSASKKGTRNTAVTRCGVAKRLCVSCELATPTASRLREGGKPRGTTYVLCREVGLPLRVPVPVLHSHCVLTGEARTPALIVLGFDVDRTRSERRLPLLPRTLSDDLDFVLSLWSIALVRIVASWPVLTMVVDA